MPRLCLQLDARPLIVDKVEGVGVELLTQGVCVGPKLTGFWDDFFLQMKESLPVPDGRGIVV